MAADKRLGPSEPRRGWWLDETRAPPSIFGRPIRSTLVIRSLGFIPSPAHGIIHVGPLPLHAYGLMLALGVLAAAKVAEQRWARKGNDPADISAIAVPVVVGGVLGARVYHLFTGYNWSTGGLLGTVQIWRGGLSIWGAVLGGLMALVLVARHRHLDLVGLTDAIAPAVLIGQAIGRFGNYFNQELFGRPTTLPWALEIDVAHRPAGYTQYATFHPTFLYESLWCLLVFGIIVFAERRIGLRKGQASAMYVCLYTLGRTWFEALRVDKATHVFGIRFNLLVSAALCIGGAVWFVWLARQNDKAPDQRDDAMIVSATDA
jgi:prolipoprotein diacylglyceryl transferase